MIYKSNNIYYLKSGKSYVVANVEIRYSPIKEKNVLVITPSDIYTPEIEEPVKKYSFRELEKDLCEEE